MAMFAMSAFGEATAFAASPLRLVNAKGEEVREETFTLQKWSEQIQNIQRRGFESNVKKTAAQVNHARNTDTSKITFKQLHSKRRRHLRHHARAAAGPKVTSN